MSVLESLRRAVDESCADPARKIVARNYISALEPLDNGSGADIKSLSRAMLAQGQVITDIYLSKQVTIDDVSKLVADCALCKGIKPHDTHEQFPDVIKNTPWLAVATYIGGKFGWPLSLVVIAMIYQDTFRAILGGFIR